MMKCRQFVTSEKSGKLLFEGKVLESEEYFDAIPSADENGFHPGDIEGDQIRVYPEMKFQKWTGFGGAFTDSAARAWLAMDEQNREKLINAYFSPDGLSYNYGRMHIGSCDFTAEAYSYTDKADEKLSAFSIERENSTVYAMISAAQKVAGEITLFASPWSPPPFMKDNGDYRGGKLKKEYFALWADYIARFIKAYAEKGVNISAVTVQNEPRHAQTWESCVFTKEEELAFAAGYLAKVLKPLGVKIYVYDHCKERVFERASYAFENCNDVDGIACHWYSGDYFDEIALTRRKFPDKDIVLSEACVPVPLTGADEKIQWQGAWAYCHDIMGDAAAGANAFCEWNLTLDENRGPSHFRLNRPRLADVPVVCDKTRQKVILQPAYYVIGQFSKFIKKDAYIIGCSKPWRDVEIIAALNPDGGIAVVARNSGGSGKALIHVGNLIFRTELEENSLTTFVIK